MVVIFQCNSIDQLAQCINTAIRNKTVMHLVPFVRCRGHSVSSEGEITKVFNEFIISIGPDLAHTMDCDMPQLLAAKDSSFSYFSSQRGSKKNP